MDLIYIFKSRKNCQIVTFFSNSNFNRLYLNFLVFVVSFWRGSANEKLTKSSSCLISWYSFWIRKIEPYWLFCTFEESRQSYKKRKSKKKICLVWDLYRFSTSYIKKVFLEISWLGQSWTVRLKIKFFGRVEKYAQNKGEKYAICLEFKAFWKKIEENKNLIGFRWVFFDLIYQKYVHNTRKNYFQKTKEYIIF